MDAATSAARNESDQNGTTRDQTIPLATTGGDQTATKTDQTRKEPSNGGPEVQQRRREYLQSLHEKGGFILTCEAFVSLYRLTIDETTVTGASSSTGEECEGVRVVRRWEGDGGGILSIVSQENSISIVFSDVSSGEMLHEFNLRSPMSRYSILAPHFHSFTSSYSDSHTSVRGMGFKNEGVARKISQVVSQLLSEGGACEVVAGGDSGPPATKRVKLDEDKYSDWVIISNEDVPVTSGDNEPREGGREETDFSLFPKKKDEANKGLKIDEISGPSHFRHLTQTPNKAIGSTLNLAPSEKGAESTTPTEKGAESSTPETFETGTKRSSSFMEFAGFHSVPVEGPISVSPPVAPRISPSLSFGLTSSSSFASSFSGSSLELPPPPPHETSSETLFSQINTFDRKALHHVRRRRREDVMVGEGGGGEDVMEGEGGGGEDVMEGGGGEGVIGAMLKNGFDLMLPKLREKFRVSTVGSINSEGEEEGFDDFDGTIFE